MRRQRQLSPPDVEIRNAVEEQILSELRVVIGRAGGHRYESLNPLLAGSLGGRRALLPAVVVPFREGHGQAIS